MAKGTGKLFNAAVNYVRNGVVDFDAGTWRMILVSNSITALTPSETNPARGSTNITEVANAGSYTTGGILLTLNNSESNGILTVKLNLTSHPNALLAWAQQSGSPNNIKTAVLIDDAATSPVDAAVKFWDLTEDSGTTPISLASVGIDLIVGVGANGHLLKIRVSNP